MKQALKQLIRETDAMRFTPPVTHVYNPLRYAWQAHRQYLDRFGRKKGRVLLLGMNPGPWGMAQTGIPFGEVAAVSEWMKIDAAIDQPREPHNKRPVTGFQCSRSEVSGRRVWTWAKTRFETPDAFFDRFFVHNYCPLMFLEESGRNRTPDKLPQAERNPLFEVCDTALKEIIEYLEPEGIVGVGAFAEKRAKAVWKSGVMGKILHPSPASPAANRGWAEAAERQFTEMGIPLD